MFLPPAFLVRVEEPRARLVLILVILLYASQGRALLDAAVGDEPRRAAGLVPPWLPEVVRRRVVQEWIGVAIYRSFGGVRVLRCYLFRDARRRWSGCRGRLRLPHAERWCCWL